MGTTNIQQACPVCKEVTLHTQTTPNHLLHLLLTVFTVGLWLFVWIPIAMGKPKNVCTVCSARQMQATHAAINAGTADTITDMCIKCARKTTHVRRPDGGTVCMNCVELGRA